MAPQTEQEAPETRDAERKLNAFMREFQELVKKHGHIGVVCAAEVQDGDLRWFNSAEQGSPAAILTLSAQLYALTRERFEGEMGRYIKQARAWARKEDV